MLRFESCPYFSAIRMCGMHLTGVMDYQLLWQGSEKVLWIHHAMS